MKQATQILLTGAGGMVGRNLLEHPAIGQFDPLTPSRKELDLRDVSAIKSYLRIHRPSLIIHAAGKVGGIQANIREPVGFLLENLDMGRNIVYAAREAGVPRLINLGSSCMYPRDNHSAMPEELVFSGGLEPTNEGYALAKVVVARLCQYVGRENSTFQYKTVIPCNLYGRYDKFDEANSHLVAAIIKKLAKAIEARETEVEIWGDGKARREFLYAGDLADLLVRSILEFDSLPSIMNVGPGHDYTVDEYYSTIASIVGYKGSFTHNLDRPIGMTRKLMSVDRQLTWGWSATTSLSDGVKKTVEFYQSRDKK